jgi:hypothetical protein
MSEVVDWPLNPITEETFVNQNWERYDEIEITKSGKKDKYYYFMLPLPKDNPDDKALCLISTTNDEYEDFDFLKKGEYLIEVEGTASLGICRYEEELAILYKALTKQNIED